MVTEGTPRNLTRGLGPNLTPLIIKEETFFTEVANSVCFYTI
jgi:hypothetical protein